MSYSINFSEEKNQILKIIRGVGFDEAIEALINNFIKDIKHHNIKKYPHQSLFLVEIKKYVYAIPYVINKDKKEIFLKTIYPSRKYTRIYKK